ncbi:CYTH domain-containing protein [Gynuella sp.]|uniref:CYTH domain-containing protein n=1 Tax=Gynuella sp. TaxID=2969146 RepID=UPI003D0DD727
MGQEIELKLVLSKDDIQQFRRHEIFSRYSSGSSVWSLSNRYFDTVDQALTQAGVALRIRCQDNTFIQTVKAGGSNIAGLHQRTEHEWLLEGDVLDLSLIPSGLIPEHVNPADIRQQFATDFERECWLLQLEDGAEVEVVLDQGAVKAGHHCDPICEVELELKCGEVSALFELARQLGDDIPLVPSDISKAERGYRLLNNVTGACANVPVVKADDTVETAFAVLLGFELESLQRQWEAFHFTQNWTHLYSFRSTLGNIRTHFLLFKDILPNPSLEIPLAALSWLEDKFNPMLNWWPACYALSRQANDPPRTASEALQQAKARHALEQLLALEQQPEFGLRLLSLSVWLHDQQWRDYYDDDIRQRAGIAVSESILEPLRHQCAALHLSECGGNASYWLERQPMVQGLNHLCRTLEGMLDCELTHMRNELDHIEDNLVELNAMDVVSHLGDWLQRLSFEEKQSVNSWARTQPVVMRNLNVLAQKLANGI